MTTAEIRNTFLRFFEAREHQILPGVSLVPVGDPSVLLTSAGMQQFKQYFSGERPSPYPRIATVQKIFRATDFDEVGDLSHLTLFEMLGNFSFGDYFKEDAIRLARELVLDGIGIDLDRVWVTVYEGREGVPRDDESAQIWTDLRHPAERIAYAGEDNFWGPTGDSGPCGPTTEIHINLRPDEPDVGPLEAPDRYLEIWNLVFNQYLKTRDGRLERLERDGVDTGAGLERWAVVLQDVASIYDTDIWVPLIAVAASRAGLAYQPHADSGRSLRIVAQHTRAAVFLVGDGVMPGNEGRGYVLRRSVRQAVRHARLLGVDDAALRPIAAEVVEVMGDEYADLRRRRDFILDVLNDEEARFRRTLDAGMTLLDEQLARLPPHGRLEGSDAFVLYDTYGFPLEITDEVVRARGMTVDHEGFQGALAAQQERSRAAQLTDAGGALPAGFGETQFMGYDFVTTGDGTIVALSADGELVESVQAGTRPLVILDQTPFYGEGGGQVGDTGSLVSEAGELRVDDTLKNPEGTIVHLAEVTRGTLAVGDVVRAEVDHARRFNIMRNHSATHLLHAALRRTLGQHVTQAGSLVAPDRLRFDFTHPGPLTADQLREIQDWVNGQILADVAVGTESTEVRAAVERGAMALFGEKYGEIVRMVSMGDVSRELCGGTHCEATNQIGLFAITSETGIAAGVRRIEAVTGLGAADYVRRQQETLDAVALELGGALAEAPERVRRLKRTQQEFRRRLAASERTGARQAADELLAGAEALGDLHVIAAQVRVHDRDALRELTGTLGSRLEDPWVIVLASVAEGRPSFISAASPAAVRSGVHAGELAKSVAAAAGGGGGGRPELAMAGGGDPDKIAEALDAGRAYLRKVGVPQ